MKRLDILHILGTVIRFGFRIFSNGGGAQNISIYAIYRWGWTVFIVSYVKRPNLEKIYDFYAGSVKYLYITDKRAGAGVPFEFNEAYTFVLP